MDSRSSTPRHSFAGRLPTKGDNRGLGSSSSSISSKSTANRHRVCYVCEEAEQLPTKALVGCITCKKLWHHNCHYPSIPRDLENLHKPFTCDRCTKQVKTAQNSPIDMMSTSPPMSIDSSKSSSVRCVILGCSKVPSKDPITEKWICKNHSISEKHKLFSAPLRKGVAMKTARVNKSKVNTIRKPEDRKLLTDPKHKRSSTKKSLDSTGFETTARQSNTRPDKRRSPKIGANASTSPRQLETTQKYSFVAPSPRDTHQVLDWIRRHCQEDLHTALRSWLGDHINLHPHDEGWWVKLRDLFWTANSEKRIKEAITALNKAIRRRMQSDSRKHPEVLADTRSMLHVKQLDIERAISRMEKPWSKDTHQYGDIESELEVWQACYHACGIIVPRDPEEAHVPSDPILPDDLISAAIEDNLLDDMNYAPPSPELFVDLLDREEIRASQKAHMEAPKETSTVRKYISPFTQAAASFLPSVGVADTPMLDVEATMQLPAPASQLPAQGVEAANSDEEDLYGASPPRASTSNMPLERDLPFTYVNKSKYQMQKVPTTEPVDASAPEPMDTSSDTTPVAANSLAGTGYLWEAPKGSLEAKRRARSMLPEVIAKIDKWFPPPKDPDSEQPVDARLAILSLAKKKNKKKKKSYIKYKGSQIFGNIDPTRIYPQPHPTPEQLAIKRAELKANPPGKERKANFGIVFTEKYKAERRAKGLSIYILNIQEIDSGPQYQKYVNNLEDFLNIEGIDNYEPFGVKGVDGICMREMVGTKVKEIVRGKEVERVKKVSELNVISDDRRLILFKHFRGC